MVERDKLKWKEVVAKGTARKTSTRRDQGRSLKQSNQQVTTENLVKAAL